MLLSWHEVNISIFACVTATGNDSALTEAVQTQLLHGAGIACNVKTCSQAWKLSVTLAVCVTQDPDITKELAFNSLRVALCKRPVKLIGVGKTACHSLQRKRTPLCRGCWRTNH